MNSFGELLSGYSKMTDFLTFFLAVLPFLTKFVRMYDIISVKKTFGNVSHSIGDLAMCECIYISG